MPQYWSEEVPCGYCGATSNTTHQKTCMNYKIYDENGRLIRFVPDSQQLSFDFNS